MQIGNGRTSATLIDRMRRVLQWLFVTLLFLMLLPQGSVNHVALHLAATSFFVIAALSALVSHGHENVRPAITLTISIAALLAVWIIVQAAGFSYNPLANPIWGDVERIYGPVAKSISVAPGDTMQGLIIATLPFAIFIATALLFTSEAECIWLVKAIVYPGVVLTVIGLIQFEFAPDMLLFERKLIYLQSATITFVNPNNAATYLAMLLIFSCGLAFHSLQNAGFRQLFRYMIGARSMTRPADARACILATLAAGIVLAALMLTRSRAGVAAGMLGLVISSMILAYYGTRQSGRTTGTFLRRRTPATTKLLRAGLILVVVLAVGGLFSGQVIMRAQVQGSNDLRFCFLPSIVQMGRDNWLTGTGFGTFQNVFPAYRDPTCGLDGVLARAHNFYLEGWIALGLPFIILGSVVLLALFYYLIQGIRTRRQYRWVAAAGLGVLVTQVLHNSIDFSIQIPAVAAIFAALMGLSVSVATGRQARPSSPENALATTTVDASRPAKIGTNSPFR